jgi:Uma2 family endonuclease
MSALIVPTRPSISPPPAQTLLASLATFRRWTPKEYDHLTEIGVLTTEDQIELIDGYMVTKMPQNPPHSATIQCLTQDLVRLLPVGWQVRIQLPIELPNGRPEPDAAIVRGDRRTYANRRPTPADIAVVIEVSDTTLAVDQQIKQLEYAAAGIPVYWIVNLMDRRIEVYTDPDVSLESPAYRTRTNFAPGQAVPLTLDGVVIASIPVADVLP